MNGKKIIRPIVITFAVLLLIIGVYIVASGFTKDSSAYIDNFALNSDLTVMTIHTGVGSSVGCIRKVNTKLLDNGELQLDFISAFGGVNGSIGAKSTYDIPIDKSCTSISIYRSNGYQKVLQKDNASGSWNWLK